MFRSYLDALLIDTNMDAFNSKSEVGEDIEYDDTSSNEQESQSENFCESIRKRKNTADACADKFVKDAKNKKQVSR